ncbi:MAG: DUF1566 domain-containing protein [Comamonas sp.]
MNITTQTLNVHIHHSADTMAAMERAMHTLGRAEATPTTSAAVPVQPGEYWPGQGGHYVCTLPAMQGLPARHLIVATDEHEEITWGPRDNDMHAATSQADGKGNTAALVQAGKHPAAQWASEYSADGHNDFHLPSRYELFMCWLCAPQLFSKDNWYWTSSQYSRLSAWFQAFEYGDSSCSGKGGKLRARPVRWIQL